jgi:alcohol dehydrogenase
MPPVIDKVLPLAQIHEAERLMEEREVFGKVVVTPGAVPWSSSCVPP